MTRNIPQVCPTFPQNMSYFNLRQCPLLTGIIVIIVSTCCVLSTYIQLHLVLTTGLRGRFCYLPPFDRRGNKIRGAVTCPRSHTQPDALKLGLELRLSDSILLAFISLLSPLKSHVCTCRKWSDFLVDSDAMVTRDSLIVSKGGGS